MSTSVSEKDIFPQSSIHKSRQFVRSFKAKANANRTMAEKFADSLTSSFGTNKFLLLNGLLFFVWIVLNDNILPFAKAFDPYPFGFLTMTVSLEAIFLSIIVLISQNRDSKISDLREEMDIQIDVITEEEVTKALQLLKLIAQKQGIDLSSDAELSHMIKPTNRSRIEEKLKKQID